jgi:hypothetical protein
MRFSAITTANAIAWVVLIGLVAVAFVLVVLWGPLGLMVLGLFTLLVCTSFNLHEGTPTWGVEVFKARIDSHGSPEQRAAMLEGRRADLSPLRFFRRCGAVLLIAGAAGFLWQLSHLD